MRIFWVAQAKHLEKDQKDCAETVAKLREKYGWIASEKQLFGKPGTDYDFAGRDAQAAQQELEVFLVEQKKWGLHCLLVSLCVYNEDFFSLLHGISSMKKGTTW